MSDAHIEYKVIDARGPDHEVTETLCKAVQHHIAGGWVPVGGVALAVAHSKDDMMASQAMTREIGGTTRGRRN